MAKDDRLACSDYTIIQHLSPQNSTTYFGIKMQHAQLTLNRSQQQVMSPQCNSLVTSCKKACVIATVLRVKHPLVSSESPSCLLPSYCETSKIQREKTICGPRSQITSSRFDALVSELPSPQGPRREF